MSATRFVERIHKDLPQSIEVLVDAAAETLCSITPTDAIHWFERRGHAVDKAN
jgi:hypothetical protein